MPETLKSVPAVELRGISKCFVWRDNLDGNADNQDGNRRPVAIEMIRR
jgi:hypothetical protein